MADRSWDAGGGARAAPGVVANDFAIKILDGAHEILIFPDGQIIGWPVARQYADGVTMASQTGKPGRIVVFNRIPALVAAAEQVGYALGASDPVQFHIDNAVPDAVEVIDVDGKTPD